MGDSKYTPNPRKYYKTNFVDLVELITPEVYRTEDLALSGTELNPVSQVINSHINVAANISNVIPLSGVANSQTSALGNISGISQYFVKQNGLTKINPFLFESKILLPLGTTLSNYDTSAEFITYLSGTLLPMIIPPTLTEVNPLQANIGTLSALTGDVNASSVHNYLVDNLGWMYFLNTSADGGLDYSPSSYVLSSLNSLYLGKTLETVDGVKGLTEYLWRNIETCSFGAYIPADFISGTADGITEASAGILPTYTSGTQKLDALQTLMDVVYSPLYIDEQDYTVKSAFDDYIDASLMLSNRVAKGPHRKFTNLMGYEFADLTNEVENIGLIYDIENVKDEYIQYIADLIGFKLRGNSPSKWRHQLRLALDLYKQSGTLGAIQAAINALIVDSVFDVSGKVQDLWESYIPHLIWYALGTESPLFKDLNTWTPGLADQAGIISYSTSSLEENIKIVIDNILLDLYKAFPDNFLFHGQKFAVPELWELDINGCKTKRYTIINEPRMKPFHIHTFGSNRYRAYKQDAKLFGESKAFEAATGFGALGSGVYMAGSEHPTTGERPTYLKQEGDLNFLFTYRGKQNYPLPPFEEVKYYRDSTVTADLVALLVERLKCFKVKDSFADEVGNYILSSAVTDDSDLGALNEMLMFFSSVQIPSNFNDVMLSISDYEKNLLGLWNGKSSHLFINFKDTDFDFAKTTLEGDGKYALYEAARVAREFSPAHAITRVNLTASAEDSLSTSSTKWEYLGFDKDDNRASYTSASVLGNFEYSGVSMGTVGPGDNEGRGGLNTFKRGEVDNIRDSLLNSTTNVAAFSNVGRRALRRRNLKYLLPHEGYYDRTGFNSPVNWDLEAQNPNLLAYTEDLGGSPGLDMGVAPTNGSSIDITGTHWRGNPGALGTFSSTLETNPFGGPSSTDMSSSHAGQGGGSIFSLGLEQYSNPVFREGYYIIQSWYIKRPTTNASLTFQINNYDFGSPAFESNSVTFSWNNTEWVVASESHATTTGYVESVGNDWYRCSTTTSGLGRGGADSVTIDGDQMLCYVYLESEVSKHLYISSPQVEHKLISKGDKLPSPYQAVEGANPTNNNDRGELTLGYVPSAGEFYPILDPINPSGVWHECEKLESTSQFSGVYTSATYPYRGLTALGSNSKMPEEGSTTARYVDRGQVPELYNTMHELFQAKAYDYANEQINLNTDAYNADAYWKNNRQSFANEAIASGFVLNSFADYENFSFGTGLQKAHRDYCKYFAKHPLGLTEAAKTGGNIFAQVFGKGLYNCDFDLTGYAASTLEGNYIASSIAGVVPIAYNSGSGVFSTCAVASYGDGIASGTYIAYGPEESVLPLIGTYRSPFNVNTAQYSTYQEFNAEFRNPNILSGIEFVQTSGAPNANQFSVFKLDSSKATPGMENALINNSVIKCKSVGGLPRLRFDLSSYGDRPNHFIKDHKFKLNVKSLVAEENSPILGGGKLGVWIHTKPKYLGNRNLLSYTPDIANSPGMDLPNGDTAGTYWTGSNLSSFSGILETDPFGGPSSMELSAFIDIPPTYWPYLSTRKVSDITTGARSRTLKSNQRIAFTWYVKRPTKNTAVSGFNFNIYDHTVPAGSNNMYFEYLNGYHEATSAVPTVRGTSYDDWITPILEDVGNDWYRCGMELSGLGDFAGGDTVDGDEFSVYFYLREFESDLYEATSGQTLWISSPQVEQWPIGGSQTLPTAYEAVVGNMPDPVTPNGYLWSWTPNGKWEVAEESTLSIPGVKNSLAHIYDFPTSSISNSSEEVFCLGNNSDSSEVINNNTLKNLKDEYFENFEIEFDTRNFTIHNNSEYLDIIPIENDVYEVTEQVNMDDTNYIVEVFFVPNNNPDKYLLIDSIELQDVTQRENTGIGTGHGVATSGIPLRPFVQEDKLYLEKDQLRDVLKFYNGLAGLGTGMYATTLASRDATITSGTLELSGGSRLNYRIAPDWTPGVTKQSNYKNFTNVEIDN